MSKEGSAKTDQMRKLREEQWAARNSGKKNTEPSRSSEASTVSDASSASSVEQASSKKPPQKQSSTVGKKSQAMAGSAPEGTCTGCGKTRAVRNGKIVAHMRGFGKQCPGAGAPPK